jgi:hypothetical protein
MIVWRVLRNRTLRVSSRRFTPIYTTPHNDVRQIPEHRACAKAGEIVNIQRDSGFFIKELDTLLGSSKLSKTFEMEKVRQGSTKRVK